MAEVNTHHLSLALLGPFRATVNGELVTGFRMEAARALLAYLVMNPGILYPRASLAALFWPEQPEGDSLQNLRTALSRLRQALGDDTADPSFLLADYHTVGFDPRCHHTLDVAGFTTALAIAQTLEEKALVGSRRAMGRLRQAVELYQGDFMAGFTFTSQPFEEWLTVQRERLHIQALWAMHLLGRHAERLGDVEGLIHYARRQLELEPWQEEAHRQLMRAYLARGQRTAALTQYERCRAILERELAVAPAPETMALYQQAVQGEPGNDPAGRRPSGQTLALPKFDHFGSLSTSFRGPSLPHNLPTPPTPLFGREAEIESAVSLLADPAYRLVTIAGPGGVGKTRLALAAAARLAGVRADAPEQAFADGVWFAPLEGLSGEEEALQDTLATAVGRLFNLSFTGQEAPHKQLRAYLQTRQCLLVLDNFEQLLADDQERDGADFVLDLLRHTPGVTLLVTSRRPLELQAEYVVPLAGLPTPDPDSGGDPGAGIYASIELFAERAARAAGNFTLDATTLPHVAAICHAVDGRPLAIELAAAWLRHVGPAEIAQTIVTDLDRLQTTIRDAPARQRSMHAVFAGTWRLLTAEMQRVLAQLSVFRGSFTAEAAIQVSGAKPNVLPALVRYSLVRAEADNRYSLHELLRQFAAEKLEAGEGELNVPASASGARDRHSAYYLAWLLEMAQALYGPEPHRAMPPMRQELDNVRRAWEWAVEQRQAAWLAITLDGLTRFYQIAGLWHEAAERLGRAATTLHDSDRQEPVVTALEGRLWAEQAHFLLRAGALDQAQAAAQKVITLGEQGGDISVQAHGQLALGVVHSSLGAFPEARRTCERALALARLAGDERLKARCLRRLVPPLIQSGHYLEEALAISRRLDDHWMEQTVLNSLAAVSFYQGALGDAGRYWETVLRYSQAIGNDHMAARMRNNLGDVYRHLGDYERALSYHQGALQTFRQLGDRTMESYVLEGLSRLYPILGQEEAAWATLKASIVLSRELGIVHSLGYLNNTRGALLAARGDLAAAEVAYRQAITYSEESHHPQIAMESYAGLAALHLQQDDLAGAQAWVERIVTFLGEGNRLEGFTNTADIYLACYRVLAAARDPRAAEVLARAYEQIQTVARTLTETDCARYLATAGNRAVLQAHQEIQQSRPVAAIAGRLPKKSILAQAQPQ
ncbi:MAG: tetratricopeptide repeat protein [Chloroflexi bacterium]|nr:tetratricopeptide repeat protein [Chloroflexota bacterium]MCI0575467.1 tetratricopeptide repeat protein [Chloroflexota bacterium]MCI0648910.1 tetratricopeptide repeat protein [Chloroflexota bacterium]MCI0731114.1 tetratricopeptide repeat protein [Chloroflexota bacterium]